MSITMDRELLGIGEFLNSMARGRLGGGVVEHR